jgi:hypothetical protein
VAIELTTEVLVTVSIAVVGAWWALAALVIKQFEKRQEERFAGLQTSMENQQHELDGHLGRQDDRDKSILLEIKRVENELNRCQLDAAIKFQTKDDAGKQFGQLIQEIRGLGTRIDSLHRNGLGNQ